MFYIRRKAGSAHLGRAAIHGPRTGKQTRHAWQVGSACLWISISAQRHDSLTLAAQEAGQGLQAHQAPWLTARICKRVSKGFTPSAAQSLFSSHAPGRRRALRPVRLAQLCPRLRNESCSKEHPPSRAKRSTGLHVQRPCAAVVPSRNPIWPKTSIPGVLLHFHFRGMLHKKGVSFDQNKKACSAMQWTAQLQRSLIKRGRQTSSTVFKARPFRARREPDRRPAGQSPPGRQTAAKGLSCCRGLMPAEAATTRD